MLKYFGLELFLIVIALSTSFGAPEFSKNEQRIVGGRQVHISAHPHQISMRRKATTKSAFGHICGGSIIENNVILTAAHCVYNRQPENFIIVAGTENRKGSDGAVALVSKIVVHENYNSSTTDNDVALMFLSTPLPINNVTINTIALTAKAPKHGDKSVITGWGTTASGGNSSDKLLEVEVPIVGQDLCDEDYAKYYGPGRITDNMICAGLQGVGGKDACQGDSGGPLLVNRKLTGIVSWGFGCGFPDFPGVYTNVFRYLNWIGTKIKENL